MIRIQRRIKKFLALALVGCITAYARSNGAVKGILTDLECKSAPNAAVTTDAVFEPGQTTGRVQVLGDFQQVVTEDPMSRGFDDTWTRAALRWRPMDRILLRRLPAS